MTTGAEVPVMGFEGGRGDHEPRNADSYGSWERQETDSRLEPAEETRPCGHLNASPGRPRLDTAPSDREMIDLWCLGCVVCGNLLQQQWEATSWLLVKMLLSQNCPLGFCFPFWVSLASAAPFSQHTRLQRRASCSPLRNAAPSSGILPHPAFYLGTYPNPTDAAFSGVRSRVLGLVFPAPLRVHRPIWQPHLAW